LSFLLRPRLSLVAAAAFAAAASLAGAAHAQSLRPNILVVFDTSGSMLRSNTDDGSALCGGSGTSSRIYSLKRALREALAQVGTDEANFGLMRYPQIDDPAKSYTCPEGHYTNNSTTAIGTSCGGSGTNCNDNCRCGCRLPTHTTETTYGAWYDNGYRSALVVDVTKRPAGAKPVAGDFDPSDGNVADIYRYIDGTEAVAGGAITDPELRTHANWYTPIGRSLFYSRMYFDNFVKAKDGMGNFIDPKGACRTNIVIFVTDGEEYCDTSKAGNATLNLTTCAQTGYATFHPEVQACQLYRTSNVKTYVLTETGAGNANDLIANAGGTGSAIRVTLTDTAAVKAALIGIIAATVPPTETCNGADDNCNGQIDEGVKNMCPLDLTPARKHCAVESCNCLDDDCDGTVDEGFPTNACGGACGCAVPAERCDGLDNNCDGNIDEGFNVGASCVNTGLGACKRGGILVCNAAGTGTVCDAPVVTPTTEVCNNIDDNCDGLVDNGTLPGVGDTCGSALGTCMTGKYVCMNGQLKCNTTSMAGVEVCNGLDDDCDGVVDNGNFPTVGTDCVCSGLDPAKVGVGVCKGGKLVCRGTNGIICEGCIGPSAEICDGKDNDCDGMSDMDAKCPSGFGCREGACTIVCKPGEFPCPSGYKCMDTFCIPQRCAQVTCPSGQYCEEATGLCVDRCAGVVCNAPSICIQGLCRNCETLGCDPGQVCYKGACQTNKCSTVSCPASQACADGKCVDLCVPGKCAAGQSCYQGQCSDDKCAQVACGAGKYCDPADGECKGNACDAITCAAGERCVPTTGKCAADPCRLMQCPADCWRCDSTSDGRGVCVDNGQCKQEKLKVGQGGGGCGCAVDGSSNGGPLGIALFGLAIVLSATRRRRTR
jgi:MYXO-CTERM domain-containing protein